MTEQPHHPHKSWLVPAWVPKIFGSAVGVLAFMLMAAFGLLVVQQHRHELKEAKRDQMMEVMQANLQVLHEQTIIRDIVAEKLPKLTPDVQAKLAFEIWDGARRLNCPTWLLLAIIEKESSWKLDAVSSAGARGLWQLMPGTALTTAQAEGITITNLDQVFDPIVNTRLGLRVLQNNYRGAVMAGKSPEGDFTKALYHYNGGGESYARLVMEKASPFQKRLAAPLQGRITLPEDTN